MKTYIGDTGDNVNGLNMCYILVDKFFERHFMVSCSWSGGSRGNNVKHAFKKCQNILKVFFVIIRSVNQSFSIKFMEDFFKTVLKNAKKRNEAKGVRQSTVHCRPKKKKSVAAVIVDGNE